MAVSVLLPPGSGTGGGGVSDVYVQEEEPPHDLGAVWVHPHPVGPIPEFVGSAVYGNSGSPLVANLPGSVVDGDYVILVFSIRGSTITKPTEFDALVGQTAGGESTSGRIVWGMFWNTGDPTSYNITHNANGGNIVGACAVFRGVQATGNTVTFSGATVPEIAAGVENALIVATAATNTNNNGNVSTATWTNFTERIDQGVARNTVTIATAPADEGVNQTTIGGNVAMTHVANQAGSVIVLQPKPPVGYVRQWNGSSWEDIA